MAGQVAANTAQIYAFPSRRRGKPVRAGIGAQVIELPPRPPVEVVCDTGAWYHQAAIVEDGRGGRS